MSTARTLPVSIDEYLDAEAKAEFRSEYVDGEVFAMSGASRSHVLITGNIVYILKTQLKASCRVYSSDLRLWIQSAKLFTYPDVMVSCGEEQMLAGPTESLMNPSLIVEVLSKSTRNFDRGDKFMYYRSLPSVMEYLTVEQNTVGVEYWRRLGGQWELKEFRGMADSIELLNGLTLNVGDAYDQVQFNTVD